MYRLKGDIHWYLIVPVLILLGCEKPGQKLFTKLSSSDTGIGFININHETENSNILTYEYFYNGGGVAIGDINNDGLQDIYFTSNLFENKLYLNLGNLQFKDITETSGTACKKGWKTGVTMADVNADGFLDIYVCRSGSPDPELRKNILLINNGDLTFSDQASKFQLDDQSYSTQAAFFDFDRDDDLDMFLLNHSLLEISNLFNITVKNTTTRYPNVGNKFFRNDNGIFKDVSDDVGVFGPASNYGLGVSLSDINNDGWIDIYTGCDYTGSDKLLLNDSGRYFTDVTEKYLSHISKFTMGTDIADVNGDGLMDILTLDMLPEGNKRQKQLMGSDRYDIFKVMQRSGLHSQYMRNMLHVNNGNGTFAEVGQMAGISNTDWSWAALIEDFNNDGSQDIFISNGFKRDLTDNDFAKFKAQQEVDLARKQGKEVSVLDILKKFNTNKIGNYIFSGNGDLTFSNVSEQWGLSESNITNGVAYADLDNDGDLDLVMNHMDEEAGIYRNNTEKQNKNYLRIILKGFSRDGNIVGSQVSVFASGKSFVRELLPARGFQSSVDPVIHIGLDTVSNVDSVIVRWPRGNYSIRRKVSVNETLTLKNKVDYTPDRRSGKTFFEIVDNGIHFTHRENDHNDFLIHALLPRMYSTEGPALASADVNGDGFIDFFTGGAKGQTSVLSIRRHEGFDSYNEPFKEIAGSEIVDARFFDIDGDRDQDLYVVTGGYEFSDTDKALQDYLFENDGKGNFKKKNLPLLLSSGSCVREADYDKDGDLDAFIGGRITPGKYPQTPPSFLLINDGKGNFTLEQQKIFYDLGMITDADWLDVNGDSYSDLVIAGEWMPVKILINKKRIFYDETSVYFNQTTAGLWNCIKTHDFDHDGDVDFIAGNYGTNNQFRASETRPLEMLYDDFDQNGSIDPLLCYYIGDKNYPYASRDELTDQLPSFKKRFTSYASYADATMQDVVSIDDFKSSKQLSAAVLSTCYFENTGKQFIMSPLPLAFQSSPIFSIAVADVNKDGKYDIITGGNLSATRARTGKLTGFNPVIGINKGNASFSVVPQALTGLQIDGDIRRLHWADDVLTIAINNENIQTFELKFNKDSISSQ